jgi:hypothetical protein
MPTVVPLWFGGVTGISNMIDISGYSAVVGLVMPPDWTPATVTVEGSPDGENFYPMYDGMGTTILAFNIPPGAIVAINPNRLRCCKALRLLSGTRNLLVPQGAPREFGLVVETAAAGQTTFTSRSVTHG